MNERCGACSADGWLVTKNERGVYTAKRCICWLMAQNGER